MSQEMRAVEASGFSIQDLRLVKSPIPEVGKGEMLIRLEAASLNYRDLAILDQKYIFKI